MLWYSFSRVFPIKIDLETNSKTKIWLDIFIFDDHEWVNASAFECVNCPLAGKSIHFSPISFLFYVSHYRIFIVVHFLSDFFSNDFNAQHMVFSFWVFSKIWFFYCWINWWNPLWKFAICFRSLSFFNSLSQNSENELKK